MCGVKAFLSIFCFIGAASVCISTDAWGQDVRPAPERSSAAPAPSDALFEPIRPASTRTVSTRPATTRAADDPLATPESAVLHLFKLMGANKVPEVRQMLTDPPPIDQLREQVARVSWMLTNGTKFELVETRVENSAAAVMYRTIYPKARAEVTQVILIERYDRWKPILSGFNKNRYTPTETEDLAVISKWVQERLPALNAAAATLPATTLPGTASPGTASPGTASRGTASPATTSPAATQSAGAAAQSGAK